MADVVERFEVERQTFEIRIWDRGRIPVIGLFVKVTTKKEPATVMVYALDGTHPRWPKLVEIDGVLSLTDAVDAVKAQAKRFETQHPKPLEFRSEGKAQAFAKKAQRALGMRPFDDHVLR